MKRLGFLYIGLLIVIQSFSQIITIKVTDYRGNPIIANIYSNTGKFITSTDRYGEAWLDSVSCSSLIIKSYGYYPYKLYIPRHLTYDLNYNVVLSEEKKNSYALP